MSRNFGFTGPRVRLHLCKGCDAKISSGTHCLRCAEEIQALRSYSPPYYGIVFLSLASGAIATPVALVMWALGWF